MTVDISTFTLETTVGPASFQGPGVRQPRLRSGATGELSVGQAHAENYEAGVRGKLFWACNQSVITFGTGLTATGVTFHLWNPPGSPVDLVVIQTGLTVLTAGTGGHVVYAWNTPSLTAVSAGTALAVSNKSGASGIGLAKSATTLPAAPVAVRTLAFAITAAGVGNITDYVAGAIVVAPGAVLSIQGITIVGTGLCSMAWEEVPNQ